MAHQAHFVVRGRESHSQSIGITQRATPLAFAWTGDQRVRFSDFQVNEIGVDGNVVHLRHMRSAIGQNQPPPQDATAHVSEAGKDGNEGAEGAKSAAEEQKMNVSAEDVATLAGLAGDEFANNLVQFFQSGMGVDGGKTSSVASDAIDEKSKRAQIHGQVRRIFKSTIETSTSASGAIIATRAPLPRARKRGRAAREQGEDGPVGEYLHFTLYKDNRDTMDAVSHIARVLRLKPQSVGYAGTKDRRASTAQRCSLRHVRQRALAGANAKLWGIETGDYEYRDEPIHLGQLRGNEFVIMLKNCRIVGEAAGRPPAERLEALKTHVQAALNLMTTRGWINYFGHQRFGTYQIGTHEIGKLIIGGKWEEAVMALLSYDQETASRAASGEVPADAVQRDQFARHHACMLFRTGRDPERAAKMMPARFAAESCLVRHLAKAGRASMKDYAGALTHITRGLRSMYLHAYQSQVWNHAASRRWELHGDRVVAGDLVMVDEGEAAAAPAGGQDQDGDDVVDPPTDDGGEAGARARPLTEEEASSGRYGVDDVVLPLPGYDVVYPDNDVGRFYADFMAREENGGLDPHRMRRLRREFSLPGRYRKLMARFLAAPSVDFRLYADDVAQLHPTDRDLVLAAAGGGGAGGDDDGGATKRARVEAESAAGAGAGADETQRGPHRQPAPAGEDDAPAPGLNPASAPSPGATKVAAVVKFQLGSSAYATVALRELMGDLPDAEPAQTEAA